MKKSFKNLVVTVMGVMLFAVNANAAELSFDGANSDPVQSHLHFVGDIQTNMAGRTATMFMLMPGSTLDNTNGILSDNILFVDSAHVEFEGGYEFEFDFRPDTSVLNGRKIPVYIVCGESVYNYNYEYKSWDEIKALLEKINDTGITYAYLEEFYDILGLENAFFTDSRYTETIIKRINELKNLTYDNNGIKAVTDCFNNAKSEFELLIKIGECNSWTEVDAILSEITDITGVTFSYKNANKQNVLKSLLTTAFGGAKFFNANELKTEFDNIVNKNIQSSNKPSSSGGGGGGGGAAGSGNSVTRVENTVYTENTPAVKTEIFDDIKEAEWAREAIENLSGSGIISGTGNKKFEPMRNITREEFVKLAVITFGVYDASLKSEFSDTNPDEWYSSYIASAKKAGIVTGVSETEFGLGRNITRQDMAVILYKGAMKKGYTFGKTELDFTDSSLISAYAFDAVGALASRKIINGMGDGSFAPLEYATRAQAAKMIYSLIGGDAV